MRAALAFTGVSHARTPFHRSRIYVRLHSVSSPRRNAPAAAAWTDLQHARPTREVQGAQRLPVCDSAAIFLFPLVTVSSPAYASTFAEYTAAAARAESYRA
ncbi:hypothetical protein HYPSUDRAFT_198773 [Hypholoma sublateritium FD-334 SS-4]|uniref:Uncharacterized protein n=1 Tax=Hypholoma sublateritium (strain FD-334 SS-4) TaxID=945553 RepID=A0A0D2P6B2_HYPSF|nr:hypothetical protein HYPSUDRAFT_198773 [Hypholoma sublateritium FD-334 SS-4]